MGGPRFTGKIQSVHRKVQLAKAKPYNLDKSLEPSKPAMRYEPSEMQPEMMAQSPAKLEIEPHVVPSSDEEIHQESQPESSESKDDVNNEAVSEESNESRLDGPMSMEGNFSLLFCVAFLVSLLSFVDVTVLY